MYKIISWYLRHFNFPHRGWKYFRSLLRGTGLYERVFIKKLHNGSLIHVCPADHIQSQLFWYGYYEKEAVLCWEALVQPGFTVLDIGANTGYYSLIAAARQANVYAFEPASPYRAELEANIRLNKGYRITVASVALSNKKGFADLFIAGTDNRGMSGFHEPDNFSGKTEKVEVDTADAWTEQQHIGKTDMIKIDTEGAEMEILEGIQVILNASRPILFMEVQPEHLSRTGRNIEDLYRFMKALQYEAYLPEAKLGLKRVMAPTAADVVIFAPAGTVWPAGFRVHD